MDGCADQVEVKTVALPLVVNQVCQVLACEHFNLIRIGQAPQYFEVLFNQHTFSLAIAVDFVYVVAAQGWQEVYRVLYLVELLGFWLACLVALVVGPGLLDHLKVIFMEYLSVVSPDFENAKVVGPGVLFVALVGGWPLVELKFKVEHVRVQ